MLKKMQWLIALVLLLSLPALACSVFGGDEEATAVPVAEPAQVEEPASQPEPTTPPPAQEEETAPDEDTATEPSAEGETAVDSETTEVSETTGTGEAPALSASALELSTIEELPFDSYRVVMTLEFAGVTAAGEEVTQSMNADFAFSSEPPANSMTMSFSGIEEDLGVSSIEMAQIENTTYMVIPEMGCVTTQGEDMFQENPFADMLAPDQIFEDLEDAKFEGEETINNIRTLHYSFDQFALKDTDTDEIEWAEGHIYIAKEGGFLVRMTMDATGKIDFFDEGVDQDGDLHIEINLTDVDEPVDIVIPASCETGGGGGADFPMLDDAYEVSSFAGVLSYKTALSTDDALVFYEDALAAEGWVKDESGTFIGGGSALVAYTRDGESLNLTITPDDESGGSYIILISETE